MFTGIIEKIGIVKSNQACLEGHQLVVEIKGCLPNLGDSIAVNGVCLTVRKIENAQFHFDVSAETLACTTLKNLAPQDEVNIEEAFTADKKLGGHFVTGHVDITKVVIRITKTDAYQTISIGPFLPNELKYLAHKGSVTINGVSLTINAVSGSEISLCLVPHTLQETNLKSLGEQSKVNVEFDYLAKLVSRQVEHLNNMNGDKQVATEF